MEKIYNYINGENVPPYKKNYLDNINPATGEVYSQVPDSCAVDMEKAISAAKNSFLSWRNTTSQERAKILRKIATLMTERKEELARAETIDNGKPISLSTSVDLPRSIKNFEFFSDAINMLHDDAYQSDGHVLNYTSRKPLGVIGCITPWNLPLYLLTWKIAPCLVMGNTVVAKPSEMTPMTAFLLGEICTQAGLPKGVLNIVHGQGNLTGETLVTHTDVRAISFTGSTVIGKKIAGLTAQDFKKISLEMGGKNPNIIFADCDFEKALSITVRSSFSNQGQICLCGSRIFVEHSIYHKFKEALIEKVRKLKIGDPLDPTTDQGAVVSLAHKNKILSHLSHAKEIGGKFLIGGKEATVAGKNKNGYFIEPTLIEGLDPYCRTNQEEIFGPVATISSFKNEEEAIHLANNTAYGLSGSLWTQDISRALRVAQLIDAGVLWINTWMLRDVRTPFGGMKESGIGREGGYDALRFCTEVKNICIEY